jgi:hypothetical protein
MKNIISHIKVKCLGGKPSYGFLVQNFDWKILTTVLFLECAQTLKSSTVISLYVAIQTEFCWNSVIFVSKLCKAKSDNCCTFCISYYILSVFVTNQDVSSRIKIGQNMACNSPVERSVIYNIIVRFATLQVCFIERKHYCANLNHV